MSGSFSFSGIRKSVDRVEDQTIAVDGAFEGDTEEGVVVDFFGTFAAVGGAERTATGEGDCSDDSDSEDEKLFHDFTP